MKDFLAYLENNYELIKENIFVFIMGWTIFFLLGCYISNLIHKITDGKIERKYEDLQKKYDQLGDNHSKLLENYESLKEKFFEDDVKVVMGGIGDSPSKIAENIASTLQQKH